MENVLVESALQHGIWAALFVGLFIWVMRDHARREEGYKAIIHELTEKFGKLDESVRDLSVKLGNEIKKGGD